jgi:hypothetical protein
MKINEILKEQGVAEGGDAFMQGIKNTPEYKQGFTTGKLPVPYPEGTQEYASYYKGVIDKATPTLNKQGVAEGGDVPHWRVEQSKATGRYYVVTGYTDKSYKVWKSKKGTGDFVKKADAEAKAQELNQGVAEGSDNIRSMIQQYEDMVELVYDLPPGRKKNIAIDKRDALEAQIEAMPGGSEALRKWARAYNDSFDEGVAEGNAGT